MRCSSLTCDAGEIPVSEISVRLVTYWNVGYPRYPSRSTYRRTPELPERVGVHSSLPGECRRYWIQVHGPGDAKPGLYRGVAETRKEFGAKVYAAVKAAGIRTYATQDPTATDAALYRPYIDVECSQPYSVPYEKIIRQDRYEDRSYPNHNAGEIKDRRVMCKGGRMTYGFGFWRRGDTTRIPWNWNRTPGNDPFDDLRSSPSGCGRRIDEKGEVIPAVSWECFREGADDAEGHFSA